VTDTQVPLNKEVVAAFRQRLPIGFLSWSSYFMTTIWARSIAVVSIHVKSSVRFGLVLCPVLFLRVFLAHRIRVARVLVSITQDGLKASDCGRLGRQAGRRGRIGFPRDVIARALARIAGAVGAEGPLNHFNRSPHHRQYSAGDWRYRISTKLPLKQ
jgi:hypothetical protein